MFMNTLCIESTRIHRALLKAQTGSFVDQRGKHPPANATSDETKAKIRTHIESFPSYSSHYRRSDTPDSRYLPSGLNMTKMHSLYMESVSTEKNHEVSLLTYKRIFGRHYNLKFQSPKKDTCKTCDELKIQTDAEKSKSSAERDQAVIEKLMAAVDNHHHQVELAKQMRAHDIEQAKQEDYHVICFDLQKTFPLPKLSTGEAYYKRQLTVFNFGIHNFSSQQGFMFVWHEGIASRGAQEVSSCLLRYVKENVTTKKLVSWSDACGGQNRNIKVALLWMHLVALDSCPIEVIEHKFCVSGHSYLPNDRDFSQIENKLRKISNMYSFDEFCNVVSSCKQNKKKFVVTRMTNDYFYSTEPLQKLITNRKKDVKKEKVNWLNMKILRVEKARPGVLLFKYNHDPDAPFFELDLRKRLGGPPPCLGQVEMELLLHPNGHGISRAKYNDIQHLLKYVPPVHHEFFINLVPDDGTAVDVDFDLIDDDQ